MKNLLFLLIVSLQVAHAAVIEVANGDELRKALVKLKDGDVLKIAPGKYPSGHTVKGIANLTVEGANKDDRPIFEGGNQAWHFVRTPGLKLRNVLVRGQKMNGINLDDGGKGIGQWRTCSSKG